MTTSMGGQDWLDRFHDGKSLFPAVKVGALSGSCGAIYGGVSGILKAQHPIIRSISAGAHWFAFGTSFWWLRSNIIRIQSESNTTPQEGLYPSPNEVRFASAISAGLAGGGVNWAVSRRFTRGFLAFSLFGYLGQRSFDWFIERRLRQEDQPKKSWGERFADSRWTPIKNLSDEQYKTMLNDKLMNVEVEIALVDEKIHGIRESQPNGDVTEK